MSRATGELARKANALSGMPSISADGRFVAFMSRATNLVADDRDAVRDIFVRDLKRGTTTLVSRAGGVHGAKDNRDASLPVISADGKSVAFTSRADNLSPADRDTRTDVYVRDLPLARTRLVSRASGRHGRKANHPSEWTRLAISGDGRRVVFSSIATNLDPADRSANKDIFVRDLRSATTRLVSRASGAHGVAARRNRSGADSSGAAISADGRRVAFDSDATNLSRADTDQHHDVYARDID